MSWIHFLVIDKNNSALASFSNKKKICHIIWKDICLILFYNELVIYAYKHMIKH